MPANDTSSWRPEKEVELVAGTPAGGGQDRPARALIDVLTRHDLVGQPIRLTNMPGRGGGNAWDYLHARRGDPHVLAINSPTIISNKLLGVSDLTASMLSPIANLYTEYPVFVVRPGSRLASREDLLAAILTDVSSVRIALATAIGNTNHIALGQVTAAVGADVRHLAIEVFDSARYAIAHVVDGQADLGVITAVSALPELASGALGALAVSAPRRLAGPLADVPTWAESGIRSEAGMWRGLIAAADLTPAQISFWAAALTAATSTPEWKVTLDEKLWADTFLLGEAEAAFLDSEARLMKTALDALGLLPA